MFTQLTITRKLQIYITSVIIDISRAILVKILDKVMNQKRKAGRTLRGIGRVIASDNTDGTAARNAKNEAEVLASRAATITASTRYSSTTTLQS